MTKYKVTLNFNKTSDDLLYEEGKKYLSDPDFFSRLSMVKMVRTKLDLGLREAKDALETNQQVVLDLTPEELDKLVGNYEILPFDGEQPSFLDRADLLRKRCLNMRSDYGEGSIGGRGVNVMIEVLDLLAELKREVDRLHETRME